MRFKKVFISGGFVLCCSVLCLFIKFEFFCIILLAALLHEAGHLLAIKLLGGKLREVRLECVGVTIGYDGSRMSYVAELITAFAGPFANLLLAFIAALIGKWLGEFWLTLSGFSLVLSIFNLLPVSVLDGGRMLYMTMAQCWDLDIAERSGFAVSCAFSLAVMILGAWILKETGWNFTLLLCGVWLFWGSAIVKKTVLV